MNSLKALLSNSVMPDISGTEKYAAILGESPSSGARSPILWNEVFKLKNINAVMHPFDVKEDNFSDVLENLARDKNFIGGAVAVPYKVLTAQILDNLHPSAELCGAVNNIFRNSEGELIGANTDGMAALEEIKMMLPANETIKGKSVAILGFGGTARAVAASIVTELGSNGTLKIFLRDQNKIEEGMIKKLSEFTKIEVYEMPIKDLEGLDILINCSSIGYEGIIRLEGDSNATTQVSFSPLSKVPKLKSSQFDDNFTNQFFHNNKNIIYENLSDSIQKLQHVKEGIIIYDVVYQPQNTKLVHIAKLLELNVKSGLGMNLGQAAIGCLNSLQGIEIDNYNLSEITTIMEGV